MKIKKGDTVVIISGKDRGKNGKILKVFPAANKILVEGIFLRRRHQRPKKAGQKGEIVSLGTPIHHSNAALFCKNCDKGTKVVYKLDGGQKLRLCKKCKNII